MVTQTDRDDYDRMKDAEEEGAAAWVGDLRRRFDFDKRPKNPYPVSDCCHHWWWVGYTDAMVIWFNDGVDPHADHELEVAA